MGMQETYNEDDVIIYEKADSRFMFMVLEGSVALYINYKQEDEYLLGICNKGNIFGEMGLLCHDANLYTAVAFTKVTVVRFSESELGSFIKSFPEKALGIMRNTARMNKVLNLNLKMVMKDSQQLEMYKQMYSEMISENEDEKEEEVSPKWRSTIIRPD